MCGFSGIYSNLNISSSSHLNLIKKMNNTLSHRGPDAEGLRLSNDSKCIFGHRRLSIIDLDSKANQPMSSNCKKVHLVFNGEIYNFKELKIEISKINNLKWITDHSDTEVILNAYLTWGIDCIKKFNGMFAIAIYDERSQKPILHLIRDRIGIKPLYLTLSKNNEWVFSSEIKSILHHPHVKKEMNQNSLSHYLTFIVSPPPTTLYKDIYKIPAGHRIEINFSGEAKSLKWWDCLPNRENTLTVDDISESESIDKLEELLRKSIERRMLSDVNFGVLLSGGVDSSIIAAMMSQLHNNKINSFTIGYENHGENEFKEAQHVSNLYNTNHHEIKINEKDVLKSLPEIVNFLDEPIADNVCIPLYHLSKFINKNSTKVIQVGEGADETMLGYWWVQHYLKKYIEIYGKGKTSNLIKIFKSFFFKNTQSISSSSKENLEFIDRYKNNKQLFWGGATCFFTSEKNTLINKDIKYSNTNCPIKNLLPDEYDNEDSSSIVGHYLNKLNGNLADPEILQKITYLELKMRIPEHLLMRIDKMTMSSSIEARVPFLDHEVVEWLNRLPLEYKLKLNDGKYILKKLGTKYFDHKFMFRQKKGFGSPMNKWIQNEEFFRYLDYNFQNSKIFDHFLNKDECFKILQQCKNGIDNSFKLWTVANLVLWFNMNFN